MRKHKPDPVSRAVRIFSLFIFSTLPITAQAQGLHGFISSAPSQPPAKFNMGIGFYTAIWPLRPEPISGFQIGLPSTWVIPDNRDNLTEPLCPPGTQARDHWPERAPTYDSVFQTIEGGCLPGHRSEYRR